jgi:uncharacterized protein YggU (UPF0235/DUF167 family)
VSLGGAQKPRFCVRLTPKGGRDAIEGWSSDAAGKALLKARVAAAPEDGKANSALVELIARTLGVKKSSVRIVSGASSRVKLIEVDGDRALLARLARAGHPG